MSKGASLQSGASAFSDFTGFFTGLETASLMEEQGDLVRQDYFRQAELTRDEGQRFRAKQAMTYINSGVELVGTPQLVLKETFAKYREKARSIEVTGLNKENLYDKQADVKKQEAYADLISGIISTATLAAGAL